MQNALKKELAVLTGLYTLKGLRKRRAFWTGLLTATAAGLYFSSRQQNYDYMGKRVLITGGSRGLGLSLAWNLLKQGAEVTLLARRSDELERARELLLRRFPGAQIFTSVCDVTDSNQMLAAMREAVVRMRGLDVLINNAGAIMVGPMSTMNRADYEAQMKLHLFAVIEANRLITPYFKKRGGGRILNICSLGGKVAVPHMLPYDASKFALAGYAQGATIELARHKIIMTTAFPTVMRTGSAIQAVFKGDTDREFRWFETLDNLPGLSMSADVAAKKMLEGLAQGKSELILSLPARARILIGHFFPETMNAFMIQATRLLPSSESRIRRTGADSSRKFNESLILRPLQEIARKNEQTYNQTPHHDPEFNAGIKNDEGTGLQLHRG